jgi:hypothetical protein
MNYFFDVKFVESGKAIDLISIGIVAEDGRELYAENRQADLSAANPWVQENVLPVLWSRSSQSDKKRANEWTRDGGIGGLLNQKEIALKIRIFCDVLGDTPEFWSNYADYGWVALSLLLGTMTNLPEGFPRHCRGLQQEADRLGVNLSAAVPREAERHALADARWSKQVWDYIKNHTEV